MPQTNKPFGKSTGKRTPDGYRGLHKPGSRKGRTHETFDREGRQAAEAEAAALGLKPSTIASWMSKFGNQANPADAQARSKRAPVNLSLDTRLVALAKELDINVSRAAETGIAAEVARVSGERWLRENRAAVESSNDYVNSHGLPLAGHRMF